MRVLPIPTIIIKERNNNMLRLRPYKACDAQAVTQWLKDERAFHLWSADRYPGYPITAADLNAYYDKEKQIGRAHV